MALKNPILMATIGAAQGLRGEVRAKTFTTEPTALGDYGNLHAADGRVFEILDIREMKDLAVVRFKGVNDRNAAEALRGLDLFIERDNLPADLLEEDEFFYADLEGLEAFDAAGKSYGIITGIFDFGAGDLLELKAPAKRPLLIPFSEAAVLEINLEEGRILVDPIAAGLIDDGDKDDEERPGSRKRSPPKGNDNDDGDAEK
jgi:16S rRNA processing protein RimM